MAQEREPTLETILARLARSREDKEGVANRKRGFDSLWVRLPIDNSPKDDY